MSRALLTRRDFKELPIPQGLIAWWLGTVASIPDGWEIADGAASTNDPTYTKPGLLDVFPKLDSTANTTGGTTTHTHAVSSHAHSVSGNASSTVGIHTEGSSYRPQQNHSHTTTTSVGATTAAASNDPAYIKAVPIVYSLKGDSTRGLLSINDLKQPYMIPREMIGMCVGDIPTGWTLCDGNNGTPNLIGRYIRGIPTTGTAPGTLSAGTGAHYHDASHTHGLSGASSCAQTGQDGTYAIVCNCVHTHSAGSYSGNTDSQTVEPLYKTAKPIMHSRTLPTGGVLVDADLPTSLRVQRGLAMIHVMVANPTGWAYCDGGAWANGTPTGYGAAKPDTRSRVIKHSAAGVDGGGTGGADTHVHSDASHTHTTDGPTPNWGEWKDYYTTLYLALMGHTHTTNSTTWTNLTTQTKGNLPPYAEVAIAVRD